MRLIKILLVGLFSFAMAGSGWSQSRDPAGHGMLGYYDPQTLVFQPVVRSAVNPLAAGNIAANNALSTFSGKFVTSFTITIKSSIATTTPISCAVLAAVDDVNKTTFVVSNVISEEANVLATRTGSTAKCTVTFSYSWLLANATIDTVDLSYSVSAGTTTPGVGNLASRDSSQEIETLPIPANGAATTTKSVSATI
jgi:hypothetical protein